MKGHKSVACIGMSDNAAPDVWPLLGSIGCGQSWLIEAIESWYRTSSPRLSTPYKPIALTQFHWFGPSAWLVYDQQVTCIWPNPGFAEFETLIFGEVFRTKIICLENDLTKYLVFTPCIRQCIGYTWLDAYISTGLAFRGLTCIWASQLEPKANTIFSWSFQNFFC